MTAFLDAARFTLLEETGGDPAGGLNLSPHDPGGCTKWGISQRRYPGLDIAALTKEQALELYRVDFWAPARCELLSRAVACAHFDAAFHSGPPQAALFMQRAFGAKPDGDIGERTLAALGSFAAGRGWAAAAVQIIEQRARFLCDLVDEPEKPKDRRALHNIEGWTVRLIRLTSYVSRLG